MCIIAIKPAGVKMNFKRLEIMFNNNADGAGFAFHTATNDIHISKGYFKFQNFRRAVKKTGIKKRHEVMFHFRIATHGGVRRDNCHPFPLTSNAESLQSHHINTDVAIAHNGVIPMMGIEKKFSDTMIYIRDYLAPLGKDFVTNPAAHPIIGHSAESKLAIMSNTGIQTIGKFIESDGWLYSNESFKERTYKKPAKKSYFSRAYDAVSADIAKYAPEYMSDYTFLDDDGLTIAPNGQAAIEYEICDYCNQTFDSADMVQRDFSLEMLCEDCGELNNIYR